MYLNFNFVNIFIPSAPSSSQTIDVALIAGVSGGVGGGVLVVSGSSFTIILICCCCKKKEDECHDKLELEKKA